MPSINYHQALTLADQKKIFHSDLQCYVNYMHHFILEDALKYDELFYIFKYGMPGQFPEGRGGFTFHGDVGINQRPIVIKNDGRVAPRYGEMERYHLELGSLFRVIAPITDYYEYHSQSLAHPEEITRMHLSALSRSIPNYQKYMLYRIFAGEEYKKENTYIKSGFEKYIEPSDGDQNGYAFCLHKAHRQINLGKVITPDEVKVNELKNRLEAIAKAIRNETRKIEVDPAQEPLTKVDYPKKNLTPENLKTYALFIKTVETVNDILRKGKFDKKYMHKDFKSVWYKWDNSDDTKYEEKAVKFTNAKGEEVDWDTGETPIKHESELITIFSKQAWEELQMNYMMSNQLTKFVDAKLIRGKFILTDIIDKGEALILHRDLLQGWIIPGSVKYAVKNYNEIYEDTTDHIHAFDHSLDLLPFHSNIGLKLKQA